MHIRSREKATPQHGCYSYLGFMSRLGVGPGGVSPKALHADCTQQLCRVLHDRLNANKMTGSRFF